MGGPNDYIWSVAFSPDGKFLAYGTNDGIIKMWDVIKYKQVATFKGHVGFVRSLAFSSDGKLLASVSDDRTLKLWDARVPQLVGESKEIHRMDEKDWTRCIAFSPDGKLLASGGFGKTINLWDVVH